MKHIAVVDDDPLFLERISLSLEEERDLHVARAANGMELNELLRSQPIDCVVLDYNLGSETGLVVGHSLVAEMADPPPIVMLTGEGSERTATKAFRIGFSDYVSKRNLHSRELSTAVRSAIERREQERESVAEVERLRKQLSFDGTTGLHSTAFVAKWLEDHARPKDPQFVFAVTLRGISEIRQKLGRDIVDRAVRKFAKLLVEATDGYRRVGHLGDDVLVVVPGEVNSRGDMRKLAERLVQETTCRFEIQRIGINLVPVIAGAIYPVDGETLAATADAARYALDEAAMNEPPIAFVSATTVDPDAQTGEVEGEEVDDSSYEKLDERRIAARRRMLLHGQILIASLNTTIDCTVKDMSETGARLHFDSYFAPPETFELLIVGSGQQPRRVRRRWQVGSNVGVQFED